MIFKIKSFTAEDYIFFPGCVYNGNRFKVLQKIYPPMFLPSESGIDIENTITSSAFSLNKDGSGRISLNTGNLSVPCVGAFSDTNKTAILLFFIQEIDGKNLDIIYENGLFEITSPTNKDAEIPNKLLEFGCTDLKQFFRVFFENRKIMGLGCSHSKAPDWKKIWQIHEEKYNQMNWCEELGYYGVDTLDPEYPEKDKKYPPWQPGWVGGAMSSYALLKLGSETTKTRAIKTLDFLFSTQTKAGFFKGSMDAYGNMFGDGMHNEGTENYHLIRKSADVLYFLFKHFELMPNIPEKFSNGTKKLADAFVSLWDTYGQLGQFVNDETGELIVGNSSSVGIAPAALVSACKFFKDNKYLKVAEETANYYYENFVKKGYTTGGPGEILQCPDSESAFGLLESFVELYEATGNEKYLEMAKDMAHQCSSWVVAYNYKFPQTSEFNRLGMKSVGTVIANAQNMHSAPGICTLSGYSIQKLYNWTNDILYKELIEDISKNIQQFMSTDERPVYANLYEREKRKTPPGFMNERVNLSDWEGQKGIGEVFYGSCWCEVTSMLTIADFNLV